MSREFMIRWKSKNGYKPFQICKTLRMIIGVLNVILGVFLLKFLVSRRQGNRKY